LDIPVDHLIPTVTLRANYIHWLQDLLNLNPDTKVHGLDIGCGASCIYPLLGAAINNKNWTFLGTDIDKESLKYAKKKHRTK